MNLAGNLTRTAAEHADRIAIRLDDATLTYAQLDGATRHAAGLLAQYGVEPGDRVAIMLPNVPQFAVLYYGILRAGAVVVPTNPLLKAREVAYYLSDSGARLIFAWHGFAEEATAGAAATGAEVVIVEPASFEAAVGAAAPIADVVERDADATAVILYTSGTTGRPKGAELTHAGLAKNVEIFAEDLIELTPDDVLFGGLPLFHVFGQTCGLNTAIAIAIGACLSLLPRFEPAKALELIARDRVTVFEAVPTTYVGLLNHPGRAAYDVSSLRTCVTGGAAMPVEVMSGFEKEFNCIVLEGYGLSETSPVASFNHPHAVRKPGSIGTPIRGVEMRLVDDKRQPIAAEEVGEVGEIAIRGHNVMKGYWNNPEATEAAIQDGWFHTGDLARQDSDGYFYIVDRLKDMIIRGGYNVYPREVEEVLYEHPAVAEAAVVGVPDAEWGEEVAAVVALKPGATATPDELCEFVKNQVAAYKYPRHVRLVDTLPKGPTGKILKREIHLD
jgi:long-chain acyl-CoA synthetase